VAQLLVDSTLQLILSRNKIVPFDDDAEGHYHATAKDYKETGELIDGGRTHICTTPQGIMMFRKRKCAIEK